MRKTAKVKIIECATGDTSWYYGLVGSVVVIDTTEELGGDNSIWFKVIKVTETLEKKLLASMVGREHRWIRKGDFIVLNEAKTEQRIRSVRCL